MVGRQQELARDQDLPVYQVSDETITQADTCSISRRSTMESLVVVVTTWVDLSLLRKLGSGRTLPAGVLEKLCKRRFLV